MHDHRAPVMRHLPTAHGFVPWSCKFWAWWLAVWPCQRPRLHLCIRAAANTMSGDFFRHAHILWPALRTPDAATVVLGPLVMSTGPMPPHSAWQRSCTALCCTMHIRVECCVSLQAELVMQHARTAEQLHDPSRVSCCSTCFLLQHACNSVLTLARKFFVIFRSSVWVHPYCRHLLLRTAAYEAWSNACVGGHIVLLSV